MLIKSTNLNYSKVNLQKEKKEENLGFKADSKAFAYKEGGLNLNLSSLNSLHPSLVKQKSSQLNKNLSFQGKKEVNKAYSYYKTAKQYQISEAQLKQDLGNILYIQEENKNNSHTKEELVNTALSTFKKVDQLGKTLDIKWSEDENPSSMACLKEINLAISSALNPTQLRSLSEYGYLGIYQSPPNLIDNTPAPPAGQCIIN